MSDLALDVGQAVELKEAFRRGNWSNAQIKRFCEGDFSSQVRDVIEGNATIVRNLLLQFVGTITCVPTASLFSAKDKFVVDTSATAPVKISYLGDNFRTWFLGKTEEPLSEQTLRYAKLQRDSLDAPIITELGGEEKAETTLSEMFSLMQQQKNGEDGPLLTTGIWNLLYIKDCSGVLRAVIVYWCGVGWDVGASSVGRPFGWNAGGHVFSRQP